MNNLQPKYLRIFFIFVCLVLVFLISHFGFLSGQSTLIVDNISVGYLLNGEIILDTEFPMGIPDLYVCGILESDRDILLSIYIIDTSSNSIVAHNNPVDIISSGEFCQKIIFFEESPLSRGTYKIEVIHARRTIGSGYFDVVPGYR